MDRQTTSYETWSHEDLVRRIAALEEQLKNASSATSPIPATPPTREAPKKHAQFDPGRYHTRGIALKFAYLGGRYNGYEFARNNTTPLPTVEEELWKALVKTRLIFPESLYGAAASENGVVLTGRPDEVERLPRAVLGDWNGCGYSKCGRTDRGVSAFGQVIGLTVRSTRPKVDSRVRRRKEEEGEGREGEQKEVQQAGSGNPPAFDSTSAESSGEEQAWDSVQDELPYMSLLNRVLPPDIRILAWCPSPPPNFDARFSCKERQYRYFFTSPAFLPLPGEAGLDPATGQREGWLDVEAMQKAAKYLEGTHDFRNLCKVDPTKQLTSFTRRISEAKITRVSGVAPPDFVSESECGGENGAATAKGSESLRPMPREMQLYTFDVRGSAFLWHQVRCMVAILFLVGQGLEKPELVRELLDVEKHPRKPMYEMASDQPLVLWDCMFSGSEDLGKFRDGQRPLEYEYVDRGIGMDELNWIYVKEDDPGLASGAKWGTMGVMTDLWKSWRRAKMDEVLACQLMDMVASQGNPPTYWPSQSNRLRPRARVAPPRLFLGSDGATSVGTYKPVMQRPTMDTVEEINARWRTRKDRIARTAATSEILHD